MQVRLAFVMLLAASLVAVPPPASARKHAAPTPSPSPTVSPTPSPTPLTEAARFDRLRRELSEISANAPGRLGIAVVDGRQFSRYTARGDEAFPLAGVVQIPVAVLAYRRSEQRTFDLDARTVILPTDLRREGSDIARQHPHGGASYTNVELLRAMLIDGDTTACDVVLRELGGPKAVDQFLSKLGMNGFDIRKSEADLEADAAVHRTFAKGGDNSATPNAVANLLLRLASQELLHMDATNELFQVMSQSHTGARRLRAGLPGDAEFANQTGTSATFGGATDATNDAGILTLPGGQRVVIVAMLAESRADLATREATLESVARAVVRAYEP